jgi:hypothetical protein
MATPAPTPANGESWTLIPLSGKVDHGAYEDTVFADGYVGD